MGHDRALLVWATLVVAYYVSPLARGPWDFIASWDDAINFVDNDVIQQPLSSASVAAMFSTVKINVYEPLALLLKAIVHTAFGLDAYAVRLATLGLHLVNCMLLYATADRLLHMLHRPQPLGCFLGTLLYGVHPIHVEVVGWPSAQPYALAMLFTLLSFYTHLRSLESARPHMFAGLSLGLYVCSVLSKCVAVLAPVGIVAMDVILLASTPKRKQEWKHDPARSLTRYAIARSPYALAMMTFIGAIVFSNADGAVVDADIIRLSPSERVVKAVLVLVWPVRMFLWPTSLRFHYELPPSLHLVESPLGLLSAAAIVGITSYCLVEARSWRVGGLAAWAFYIAMLLPVSGFVQHGLVFLAADRYVYFPAIVAVPLFAALFDRIHPSQREVAVAACCVASLCLAHVSVLQLESWRTAESVFRHGLKAAPTDWRILDRLYEHLLIDRPDDAKLFLQQTLVYSPRQGLKAQLQVAKCHMLLGQTTDACAIYETLHRDHPTYAHVLNNMGVCQWKMGRLRAARAYFVQAATNGTGLTRGDVSPQTNIALVDAWDPRTPVVARIMW